MLATGLQESRAREPETKLPAPAPADDDMPTDSSLCTVVRPVVVCAPSVVLKAKESIISNSDYEIVWSTGERGASITVDNSGSYWVEYRYKRGNTVSNGNFEDKNNRQFTSQYEYKADNGIAATESGNSELWGSGTYSLTTSPRMVHINFTDMRDHTSGKGNMMVLNGSDKLGTKIWYRTITVMPNTCYVFSIYASSVHPENPAQLTFSINNNLFGAINLTKETNKWVEFTRIWYSGSSTKADIAIVNLNTAGSGNDFALDDITFLPFEREVINVDLKPKNPVITANY